jgi:transcriptional regulator with XRE-family HTH domain
MKNLKNLSRKSIPELQAILGEQLRQLRISKDVDQITVAERAGISEKSVRNLEAGIGSSIKSLLKVLKALDSLESLQQIAPEPLVGSIPPLPDKKVRRRVRRSTFAERVAAKLQQLGR